MNVTRILPAVMTALLVVGCARESEEAPGTAADTLPPASAAAPSTAQAELADPAGRSLGIVTLRESDEGVVLAGALQGLPPGEHGFHVHETGRCDPPAFESAGGHFNPDGAAHGFDDPAGPHAGDLRNLTVAGDGTATIDETSPRISLAPGGTSLLDADGSALVVHAGPDDYRGQPSGGSGDRIACGVIQGD